MVAWVLDLDGVVWLREQVIPGVPEAVARLRAEGEQVLFVTNNSSEPIAVYEERLRRMGIPAEGGVVSSAVFAASLVPSGSVALVCGGPGVFEALHDRDVETVAEGDADVVVVGYHREFDYDRLTVASTAVRRGARLIATNDDPTYPTPEGLLPGAGALVAAVATASEVPPVVAGKPHGPSVSYVRSIVGDVGTVVGDRPETDGVFARELGYRFGLVLSGVTARADLPVVPDPDVVGSDLADLVDRVSGH